MVVRNNKLLKAQRKIDSLANGNKLLDYIILQYKNYNTKTVVLCPRCKLVFKVYIGNIRQYIKKGRIFCPYCRSQFRELHTYNRYCSYLYRHTNCIPGNFKYFKGGNIPMPVYCKKCGHIYGRRLIDCIHGSGCKYCARNSRRAKFIKPNNQFLKDLHKKHGYSLKPLQKYKGANTKIWFKCQKCGYKFRSIPHSILKGEGCPRCGNRRGSIKAAKKNMKTNKEFRKEVFSSPDNKYHEFIPVDKYKGCNTPIWWIHNPPHKKPHLFKLRPSEFKEGVRCKTCHCSRGEQMCIAYFYNILKLTPFQFGHGVLLPHSARNKSHWLHVDFRLKWLKLPHYSNGIAIEFDGSIHFEANKIMHGKKGLKNRQNRDKKTTKYCKKHNIKLIRIESKNRKISLNQLKKLVYSNLNRKLLLLIKKYGH